MLISVIIPTFNRAKTLPRALESVIKQSYKNVECIVVDDGSNDITHRLLKNYPTIRTIILPQNSGVSYARNIGVKNSKGSWIAFLDSDDEWHPEKLSRQVAYCKEYPNYKILQTRELWIRNGKRVNPPKTHEKIEGNIFFESLKRCMITPSSVMLSKQLFYEVGTFNEMLYACEDYDLWLRITSHFSVGLVKEYLMTRYGGHADQLSTTVPVLDKYRIRALIDCVEHGNITEQQKNAAIKTLIIKAKIVAAGAYKRGKDVDYERYKAIADAYSTTLTE